MTIVLDVLQGFPAVADLKLLISNENLKRFYVFFNIDI